MKKIEKLLCYGAGYTVLILSLYFIIASISSPNEARMSAGRFIIILLYGYVIAGAELLYKLFTVKAWLKVLLHYAILLSAFLLILVPMLSVPNNGPASVIAWAIIFTVIYAAAIGLIHFIRKVTRKADMALEQGEKTKSKENEEYIPLYSDKEN